MDVLNPFIGLFQAYYFNHIFQQEKSTRLFPGLSPWELQHVEIDSEKLNAEIKGQTHVEHRKFMHSDKAGYKTAIPAGYTYFGQFIAHELTYSNNQYQYQNQLGQGNYSKTSRFVPRFSLNSVYGSGPELQPYLYDQSRFMGRTHFKIESKIVTVKQGGQETPYFIYDLNRHKYLANGLAIPLIPDPRNDENIVTSQLHVAVQKFHNKIVDAEIEQSKYRELIRSYDKKTRAQSFLTDQAPTLSKHGSQNEAYDHDYALQIATEAYDTSSKQYAAVIKQFTHQLQKLIQENQIPDAYGEEEVWSISDIKLNKFLKAVNTLSNSNSIEAIIEGYRQQRRSIAKILESIEQLGPTKEKKSPNGHAAHFSPKIKLIQALDKQFRDMAPDLVRKSNSLRKEIAVELDRIFQLAKQQVEWHFQWLVLFDFLPRLINKPAGYHNTTDFVLSLMSNRRIFNWIEAPYLPLEFTTAFFRFGHSMVRNDYSFNDELDGDPIFKPKRINQELNTTLDWKRFFFQDQSPPTRVRKNFASPIDPFIVSQMIYDTGLTPGNVPNIVFRNFERSRRNQLPAGQEIAQLLLQTGLVLEHELASSNQWEKAKSKLIKDLAKGFPDSLQADSPSTTIIESLCIHSPLWFYTLMESKVCYEGQCLGPVASRIIAEVIVGIVEGDPNAFLNKEPGWKPKFGVQKNTNDSETREEYRYSMIDFLRYAEVY